MNAPVKDGQMLLSVRGLEKSYQKRKGLLSKQRIVLTDVSFDLRRGEVVALVGQSGSGKTTVAKIIARTLEPSAGQVVFDGVDVLKTEPRGASLDYRSRVQMIFQDPFGSLNPVHTLGHHLVRPLLRHKKADSKAQAREQALALLQKVGLTPPQEFFDKYPHQASGGQLQRAAIARALAVEPELILADEPTSMLDVSIRAGVLKLLSDLGRERQLSYLYITHDLASARYFSDRILVMYAGYIVEEAPSDQLIDSPSHPYTKLLLSAVPDPRRDMAEPLPGRSGTPKLSEPLKGCPFASRCPEVREVCRNESPPVIQIGSRHTGRCHFIPA